MLMSTPLMVGKNLLALTNGTISDSASPLAESRVRFNTDGSIDQWTKTASVYTQFHPGEWYLAEPQTGIGNNYEIQLASFTGFAASTGPGVGVWTALSSAVEWTRQTSATGTRNWNGTLEIRKVSTTTVLATATITLQTVL
jgi:hypothetical protein